MNLPLQSMNAAAGHLQLLVIVRGQRSVTFHLERLDAGLET